MDDEDKGRENVVDFSAYKSKKLDANSRLALLEFGDGILYNIGVMDGDKIALLLGIRDDESVDGICFSTDVAIKLGVLLIQVAGDANIMRDKNEE